MIHQFLNNGYHIVLDVNSGSVHVVDPVVYDAVAVVSELVPELDQPEKLADEVKVEVRSRLAGRYPLDDVEEALEDIQELIDLEQLLTRDIYKDFVMDFKRRKTVVKALCLHIAHDCNLACKYCFAEEGEYHGRRALMSYEVGKKALDFLIANSGSREHLEVDFFGGEPLMNWDVVKRLVEYGRSKEAEFHKKFRFTLTTNGVLLNDEVMEFCNREMSNVVLSLDGRPEVNDKMRPFRNGKGSYELILRRMCCTTRTWASSRCPWSRWWLRRRRIMPSVRRIFPRFWKNMTSLHWNTSSARKRGEGSISSTLCWI